MRKWSIRTACIAAFGLGVAAVSAWSQIVTTTNHPPPELFTLSAAETNPVNGKGGSDISGPYEQVANWPQQLPGGRVLASAPGIYVESPDRIYAASRGSRKPYTFQLGWAPDFISQSYKQDNKVNDPQHTFIVTVYDRAGKMIDYWKQFDDTLKSVQRWHVNVNDPNHYNYIDGDTHIMIVDKTGKLVKTIEPSDVPTKKDERTFWPEGIAFAADGGFWTISNARVIKFSKDWKYESQFGVEGKGPDQMVGAHDIVHDAVGKRFYICDRDNHRIQVYDDNGKHLDTWPNIVAPAAIRMTKDRKYLWVADLYVNKFIKFDTNGKLITSWGQFGIAPGAVTGIHDFTTDSEGNLYVGNHNIAALQKFAPRKDGNKEQLIGELLPR